MKCTGINCVYIPCIMIVSPTDEHVQNCSHNCNCGKVW